MFEYAADSDAKTKDPIDLLEEATRPSEESRVRSWRFEQFLALGFGPDRSFSLADLPIDLNDARRLIGLGCPPDTALAILA